MAKITYKNFDSFVENSTKIFYVVGAVSNEDGKFGVVRLAKIDDQQVLHQWGDVTPIEKDSAEWIAEKRIEVIQKIKEKVEHVVLVEAEVE